MVSAWGVPCKASPSDVPEIVAATAVPAARASIVTETAAVFFMLLIAPYSFFPCGDQMIRATFSEVLAPCDREATSGRSCGARLLPVCHLSPPRLLALQLYLAAYGSGCPRTEQALSEACGKSA